MSLAGLLDPTKVGKYPVVLSDALLGKDSKETYTGIRYNHKPSSSAPSKARLKPDGVSDDGYDLSFRDDGGQYAYSGNRSTDDKKYVLVFDPTREVFVLHKVDSTFSMNVTQTPDNSDPDSLRRKYPHLVGSSSSGGIKARNQKSAPSATVKKAGDKKGKDLPFPPKKSKPAAQQQQKSAQPTQPTSSSSKQNRAAAAAATPDSDADESSDDDLLQIEEPGGSNPPPASARDFSPAFGVRRFSDFVQEVSGDEDDADGEEDDDNQSIEHFTLPSPVNRQMEESAGLSSARAAGADPYQTRGGQQQQQYEDEEEESDEDAEMEDVHQHNEPAAASADNDMGDDTFDDLEAELMAAYDEDEKADVHEPESDVSEEE